MTAEPDIVTRQSGDVVHVILNAPDRRNALSRSMLAQLAVTIQRLAPDTAGVVLSGAAQTFSAGADFRDLTGTVADVAYDDAVSQVRTAIVTAPFLVVAAIEGPCMGAAADVALACDVRVAATDSYLQVPATRLGLLYNPTAVERLLRIYSVESVRRLLLLGERLPAATALSLGLVTRTVTPGAAVTEAERLLADTPVAARPAVAATKAFVTAYAANEPGLGEATGPWQQRRRDLLASPERQAAMATAHARHNRPQDPR